MIPFFFIRVRGPCMKCSRLWATALLISLPAMRAPYSCSSKYLNPTHLNTDTAHEYVKLPAISSIRSLSLWVFFETNNDPYRWDYILDARSGLSGGYFSFYRAPSIKRGSDWIKWVQHDLSTSPPTRSINPTSIKMGRWVHLYFEASKAFSDDLNLLSRYQPGAAETDWEDTNAKVSSPST